MRAKSNLIAMALAACGMAVCPVMAAPTDVPAAVYRDPPPDKAFPASGEGLRIPSSGQSMNAMVYVPAGKGPHPVVVLLHGFPGNEQNLDLAQAMRRAGWAVVTFHYRGSWGSAGTFSFDGAVEDGAAAVAWVRDADVAKHSRFDAKRIVVIGHSMGGYVAAARCAADADLLGCGLIAPWDLSMDARQFANATDADRGRFAREEFADVDGRLSGMSARETVDTLVTRGQRWNLAQFAPEIARRPALLVLATHDSDDDKALDLLPALKAQDAKSLRVETIESDHGFNDRRIELQRIVLTWLASLQHAPGGK
jgi:acetyl esterase/lipase